MPRFRITRSEASQPVTFVCGSCVTTSPKLTYDTYNRPADTEILSHAGCCKACAGSGVVRRLGFSRECRICKGTGICPRCGGHYARDWTELPEIAKAENRSIKEQFEASPYQYAAFASFYRNW